jgi:ATP-binding cassette subfamily C protein
MLYLVCIPLIPISIMAISRRAKRLFATYRDRYISLGSAYLDSVGGMKELVIFHYDKKRQEEMKKNSEEFRNVTMKVLSMQLFSVTIMDVVAYGGAALGIIATLLGLTKGEYSRYIALFLSLIGAEFFLPMRSLGSAFHIAMNEATAGRKVLELLNEKKEKDGSLALNKVANVEFIDASYKYKDTDKFVLKDVNFTLSKGFTSLIGPSGSGKSTIAKLLFKNLAEYGGHIEVDGKELLNIKKKDYLAKVTYVSSDTFLLHKAIKEAFIFYSPSLSEKKMWELLNLVELKKRIEDAGGLSYIPKEGASDLSGGEKQRLILAYYLAVKRDFYIFDETTSNIDKDSERIIVRAIEKLSKNSIVLFISHRLQNAIDADQVIVLGKDGRIVEIGTIKELVAKDQQFARNLKKEEDSEAIL